GPLDDAGTRPRITRGDRLDDREAADPRRHARVEDRLALVPGGTPVEDPVPALAKCDGLLGAGTIRAQAPDRGQRPDLRRVIGGPGGLEGDRVSGGSDHRIFHRARLRVAEQVRTEESEWTVPSNRKDFRRRLA